jgi:hypothetical protein
MPDDEHDYKIGPGRPRLHTPFPKGPIGEPRRPQQKELAVAPGRCAERAGVRHPQRKTAKDHQARGGDPSAGQQIHQCRFAGGQDADGHDEGGRTEGRRRRTPNNAAPSTLARPADVIKNLVERIRQDILAEIDAPKAQESGEGGGVTCGASDRTLERKTSS